MRASRRVIDRLVECVVCGRLCGLCGVGVLGAVLRCGFGFKLPLLSMFVHVIGADQFLTVGEMGFKVRQE